MSTLPDVIRANRSLDRVIQTCLSGLAPNTQHAYARWIAKFQASGRELTREGVSLWLQSLTLAGKSGMSVNQAQAALKKLVNEAAEHGALSFETARQVDSLKSRKHKGVRTGRWLTLDECKLLLGVVERSTLAGKRDLAVLALLLGSGLRREEACGVCVDQLRAHNGGWYLANVRGKGSKVRTVGVPLWAVELVQDWLDAAGIRDKFILRSFSQQGAVNGSLAHCSIRLIVKHYAQLAGLGVLAPHDLRRTHASVQTTQAYLGTCDTADAGNYFDLGVQKETDSGK